jgi:hypothetical protein
MMIVGCGLLTGCGSTAGSTARDDTPKVDQPGAYISRYRGPFVEALVDYRFAAQSLGDEWMILNVAVAGTQSVAQEVRADAVSLRTSSGARIPLPNYKEFARAFPEVHSASRRAAVAASPLDFSRGDRRWCRLSFHPIPGTEPALTAVYVDRRSLCSGLLYFPVPGGIQPERYALTIELEETLVAVPFELSLER